MASRVREAAVMCWFPTKQDPIPISFKFVDDTGELCFVKDIKVISTETISQGKRFNCSALINGMTFQFTLEFFSETCRWLLKINS